MVFPLYNLEMLADCKSVKLNSFNEQSLEKLKEANRDFDVLPVIALGISKDLATHKQELIDAVNATNRLAFRSSLEAYNKDARVCEQYRNYLNLQASINNFFEQETRNEFTKKINGVKKWWEKNKTTSHMTSSTLVALTKTTIPVVESFHHSASTEIKNKETKLTRKSREILENYLFALKEEVEKIKSIICEAMLLRLEIASLRKNLEYDDVTDYLLHEIKKFGINLGEIKSPRNSLTPAAFCYFHEYVNKYGSEEQQARVMNLVWFKPDEHYTYCTIDNTPVIVPKQLLKFGVPNKTIPYFIFNDWQYFKGNFFKQNFYLLVRVSLLDQKNQFQMSTLNDLLTGGIFQDLLDLQRLILKEKKEAEKKENSLLYKIFYHRKSQFFKEWRVFTDSTQKKIVNYKIQFALRLAEQLRTRFLFDLDQSLLGSEAIKDQLRLIISSLEQDLIYLNKDQIERWKAIKSLFQSIIEAKPSIKRQSIDENEELKNLQESTAILIKKLSDVSSASLVREEELSLNHQSLDYNLKQLIKCDTFDTNNEKFCLFLKQLKTCLKNTSVDSDEFQFFWNQFIIAYLNTCIAPSKDMQKLNKAYDFIFSLAPAYIRDRIISLENNRRSYSEFMYQTQCSALLFGFKEIRAGYQGEQQIQSGNFRSIAL
jgi:hypothetical protein